MTVTFKLDPDRRGNTLFSGRIAVAILWLEQSERYADIAR